MDNINKSWTSYIRYTFETNLSAVMQGYLKGFFKNENQ